MKRYSLALLGGLSLLIFVTSVASVTASSLPTRPLQWLIEDGVQRLQCVLHCKQFSKHPGKYYQGKLRNSAKTETLPKAKTLAIGGSLEGRTFEDELLKKVDMELDIYSVAKDLSPTSDRHDLPRVVTDLNELKSNELNQLLKPDATVVVNNVGFKLPGDSPPKKTPNTRHKGACVGCTSETPCVSCADAVRFQYGPDPEKFFEMLQNAPNVNRVVWYGSHSLKYVLESGIWRKHGFFPLNATGGLYVRGEKLGRVIFKRVVSKKSTTKLNRAPKL